MKRLLVSLNARYSHKGPAVWMLREACVSEGITADVLECDIARPYSALLRDILSRSPGVVAFSCSIWNIDIVEKATAALRLALPECTILWGGPEVSYDAAERMKRPIAPDAILAGEGEETLPTLLKRLEKGLSIEGPGIVTRESDGGVAPPVPTDRWVHLYPRGALAEPHKLHYVETARGCPYSCRYCLSAVQGGVRALSARQAAERLLSARDAGARTVKVLDRTFNFDGDRARSIWQSLIEAEGGSVYHFEIAGHLLDERDIALLQVAPAGLFQFEIGVQTTTRDTLDAVGRTQDFARLASAVTALRGAGNIHLHLDLIAGLPGDSYADFARAVDDVLALRPHALQLGFLKLLPGSLLRADFGAERLPYDPSPPYEVIRSGAIGQEELARLHDIEEVLSMYWNGGVFSRTAARWLSSFASLEAVAFSLRGEGFFEAPRSIAYRFDALHRALQQEAEMDLRYDWLASGQREYRPWMKKDGGAPNAPYLLDLPANVRKRAHIERIGGEWIAFVPDRQPERVRPF